LKQLQELQSADDQNDKLVLSLKAEIRKLKELEPSNGFPNRPSQQTSSFLGQNNLKKQLKMTSEFPSIFNSRISFMKSRISRMSRLPKFHSSKDDSEEVKISEQTGGSKNIEEINENPNLVEKIPKEIAGLGAGLGGVGKGIGLAGVPVEYKYLYFDEARLL